MKRLSILAITILCFSLPATAAEYVVDATHATIGFSVKHMVISNVKGRFGKFEGGFVFDKDKVALTDAHLKIDASSIDTAEPKRDDHLRSPDFFDVKKFPEITFKFKNAHTMNGTRVMGMGDLTIKGITKTIHLAGDYLGAVKDPWGNNRVGFTLEGKINRKDFGLTWNKVLETGGLVVGDEVKIEIEVEGIEKK